MENDIKINNSFVDDEPVIPPLATGVSQECFDKFIHEAVLFAYGCEGASLAVIVNGLDTRFINCRGDGDGIVFITTKNHFELGIPFDHELIVNFDGSVIDGRKRKVEMWLKGEDTDRFGAWRLTADTIQVYRINKRRDFVIRLINRAEINKDPSRLMLQAMYSGQIYDADLSS